MAKKHKHIFNLLNIAKLVKEPENSNAYHRINLIFKGAEFGATPELLNEVEKIIKEESKRTLAFIERMRKSIASGENEKAA